MRWTIACLKWRDLKGPNRGSFLSGRWLCQCSTSWRICILLRETSTHLAKFQEVNINHIYWEANFYSTKKEKKSTRYILNFTVSSLRYFRIPKQNTREHFLTQLFNHTIIITMILWSFGFSPSIPSKVLLFDHAKLSTQCTKEPHSKLYNFCGIPTT